LSTLDAADTPGAAALDVVIKVVAAKAAAVDDRELRRISSAEAAPVAAWPTAASRGLPPRRMTLLGEACAIAFDISLPEEPEL
jgi:hypothetical protein